MTVDNSPDIHSTGQPDTPVEVLVDTLGRAMLAPDLAAMRTLVERAYKLVAGLDPYLDAVSSPPSPASAPAFVLFSAGRRLHATAHCPILPLLNLAAGLRLYLDSVFLLLALQCTMLD